MSTPTGAPRSTEYRVREPETGSQTGLWAVTATTWIAAATPQDAAARGAAALETAAAEGHGVMVDEVCGWDEQN